MANTISVRVMTRNRDGHGLILSQILVILSASHLSKDSQKPTITK